MTSAQPSFPVPKALGAPKNMEPIAAKAAKLRSFPDIMKEFENRFPEEPQGRTGLKGKLKVIKTFVEDRADTIERLSRLVPDVDYTKPIVGSLTFLLQAFKQTSKVREEVNDGIERLEKNFDLVEAYIEMYSAKSRVIEAAMTLYVTILQAIEEVIGYYTKHMVTNKLAGDVETGLKHIEARMARAEKGLRAMFKDHLTAVEAKHEKEKQLLKREIEKRDAERARFEQLYYRAITPEPPPIAEYIVKQEDLLQFLDLTGLETTDIDYITHQRELIISRGQDRTEQIMNSSRLREWLVQANSKELLIHGNSVPLPVSPISFFCAMLMQNLRGVEKFKSVAFFCGCHPYGDFGGARILIMSLLSQLLQQQPFDLSFIDHEIAYRMDGGDPRAFCSVFGRLVEQVRGTETVFCIIDGINFYECNGEEPLQGTADVLRFLLDLAGKGGPVYKILVTSPSSTEDVRQAIRDDDYLALPEQAANTRGFSKERFGRQWQEGFEDEQG
ncbi:hypothetical protein F5B21DRAFT_506913 [Xylaria acuta]|nr:hypothetical protein F5B21DRAFT_506913 [Xylaria acuta]